MASIMSSIYSGITARYGHNLLLWRDTPEFWAFENGVVDVYNVVTGSWRSYWLPENISYIGHDSHVEVIGRKIYVVTGVAMQTLDLKTNHWEMEVSCMGTLPLHCIGFATWTWKERIYVFGGCNGNGYSNQLAAFNSQTRCWERIMCSGDLPPVPRMGHSCIVSGDYMLLFGGSSPRSRLNDLYALHLPSHTWKKLQNNSTSILVPMPRDSHRLTLVGENRALLTGGLSSSRNGFRRALCDCWLLTWTVGNSGAVSGVNWSQWHISPLIGEKVNYGIEYSPHTSRIYFVQKTEGGDPPNVALVHFLANPASLRQSALDKIAESRVFAGTVQDVNDFLLSNQFQKHIRQRDSKMDDFLVTFANTAFVVSLPIMLWVSLHV